MITDRDMMLDELADEMFPMLLELISDRNFYDTYIKKAIIEELVAGHDITYRDAKDLAYSFRHTLFAKINKGVKNV